MADHRKGVSPAALPLPRLQPLFKQKSWSPDTNREEVWERRKGLYKSRRREAAATGGAPEHRLSRSVTDDDLDELRGCIDLGFGFSFDSPASSTTGSSMTASSLDETDRLSDTLPALDLYYAVQRSYSDALAVAKGAKFDTPPAPSPTDSPLSSIFPPGDNPQQVKRRLKQWAQVVACTVRAHLRRPLQREVREEDEGNNDDRDDDHDDGEEGEDDRGHDHDHGDDDRKP